MSSKVSTPHHHQQLPSHNAIFPNGQHCRPPLHPAAPQVRVQMTLIDSAMYCNDHHHQPSSPWPSFQHPKEGPGEPSHYLPAAFDKHILEVPCPSSHTVPSYISVSKDCTLGTLTCRSLQQPQHDIGAASIINLVVTTSHDGIRPSCAVVTTPTQTQQHLALHLSALAVPAQSIT